MKKIIVLALVMVLALTLFTACGDKDNGNNGNGGNNNGTSQKSQREIAEAEGVNERNVRHSISKGLANMKRYLQNN